MEIYVIAKCDEGAEENSWRWEPLHTRRASTA